MKHKPDKHQLDKLLGQLIAADGARPDVIEQVLSDNLTFPRVQRQIRLLAASNGESGRSGRYRTAYAGIGLIALLGISSVLISMFYGRTAPSAAPIASAVAPTFPSAAPAALPEVPPRPINGKLSAGSAAKSIVPKIEKAIYRTRSSERAVPKAAEYEQPSERFYPVSYTGDPAETAAGGQVIRVEMRRSALFALGVDMPLENDDPVVQADLLVSRDGIARAVRLVD